jgi:Resolvase, N terminal domain
MSHTDIDFGDDQQPGTRIGYTRVSSVTQTLDQQHNALDSAGVTKTFSDTMSGARDDRPGLAPTTTSTSCNSWRANSSTW